MVPPCAGVVVDYLESCSACTKLLGNVELSKIVKRSWDENLHETRIKDMYLSREQLQRRLKLVRAQRESTRVSLLSSTAASSYYS